MTGNQITNINLISFSFVCMTYLHTERYKMYANTFVENVQQNKASCCAI